MSYDPNAFVDLDALSQARAELGTGFIRILSYFREDGHKSVLAIEQAMRTLNSAAMVLPAHTLKGEALQFGARPLAELAEHIEVTARRCVEMHEQPTELLGDIVRQRPLFDATLALFDRETGPPADRRPVFGRKVTSVVPGPRQG